MDREIRIEAEEGEGRRMMANGDCQGRVNLLMYKGIDSLAMIGQDMEVMAGVYVLFEVRWKDNQRKQRRNLKRNVGPTSS